MEFVSLERSHERSVPRIHDLGGQSVEVPPEPAIEPPPATSEVKAVVAYSADPILRLPIPPSLDCRTCMPCVMDRVPEQFLRRRRRFVRAFDSLPEQQPDLRPARAKGQAAVREGCRTPG